MRKWFAVGATIFVLAGCASKGKPEPGQPDWLHGDSQRYPQSFYLLGRGQGAGLEVAKDRARADLAKTFQVAVSASSRDTQHYTQSGHGEQRQIEQGLRIERDLETHTDYVLEGVEVPATWRDTTTGTYHALAVLSKRQAAERLRGQVEALDEKTATYLNKARESDDALRKAASARSAIDAQRERTGVQQSLQIVDATGKGVTPKWSLAQLESDYRNILARVRIQPVGGGDNAAQMEEVLSGALGAAGFVVMGHGAADYVLRAELKLRALAPKDGWHWYTGNLLLTLSEPSGRVRGSRQWELRESATQATMAKQRVINRVSAILDKELAEAVIALGSGG